jgi:hypothetical protein
VDQHGKVAFKYVRELRQHLPIGRKYEPGTAIDDLLSNLLARKRDMDRNVHCAGQVDRQIRDDPFVSILGDVRNTVARSDACRLNRGCQARHVVQHFVPSAPTYLAAANRSESRHFAAPFNGGGKNFGNCFQQISHTAHQHYSLADYKLRRASLDSTRLENINHVLAAVLRIADQPLVDGIDDKIQPF